MGSVLLVEFPESSEIPAHTEPVPGEVKEFQLHASVLPMLIVGPTAKGVVVLTPFHPAPDHCSMKPFWQLQIQLPLEVLSATSAVVATFQNAYLSKSAEVVPKEVQTSAPDPVTVTEVALVWDCANVMPRMRICPATRPEGTGTLKDVVSKTSLPLHTMSGVTLMAISSPS